MDIREALQEPLEAKDGKTIEEKFEKIAENLFNNFCIKCGTRLFYFAEIEFYYYKKDEWEDEWNKKTYPRTDKKAGNLFFHYSGCDVCFDSDFGKGVFGGILIRSLKDENGTFITGPSVCVLEMLNLCSKSETFPKVVPIKDAEHKNKCELDVQNPIARYGIKYKEDNLVDKPLCYYDKKLLEKYTGDNCKEIFENATWDYDRKSPKSITRYYKRFCK